LTGESACQRTKPGKITLAKTKKSSDSSQERWAQKKKKPAQKKNTQPTTESGKNTHRVFEEKRQEANKVNPGNEGTN